MTDYRSLAEEARDLWNTDDEDAWTFYDGDPAVAWNVPESTHGRMAALLESAGWERCYHGRVKFHYNVKMDGNGRYRGYRDALKEMEESRPAFDGDDALEEIANGIEEMELEAWWEDLTANLAEAAGLTYKQRPRAYSCGRSAGYVNIPSWETPATVEYMILAAEWLQAERENHNSTDAGRYVFEMALEEYDARRMEGLASPRPDRVEA
jgi:hypothetical protein